MFPTWFNYLGCADTSGWDTLIGEEPPLQIYDCSSYADEFCENGSARQGSEWAMGSLYDFPEENCCVCGKETKEGTANCKLLNLVAIISPICHYIDHSSTAKCHSF